MLQKTKSTQHKIKKKKINSKISFSNIIQTDNVAFSTEKNIQQSSIDIKHLFYIFIFNQI